MRKIALIVLGVILMFYIPNAPANRQYRITVPKLDGGVNTNESLNMVADNQLTDCLNMWWKDGALRSRDGMWSGEDEISHKYMTISIEFKTVKSITYHKIGNLTIARTYGDTNDIPVQKLESDDVFNENGYFITGTGFFEEDEDGGFSTMFADVNSAGNQMLSINEKPYGAISYIKGTNGNYVRGFDEYGSYNLADQVYVPTISRNGIPSSSTTNSAPTGTAFESKNMLTSKFKCKFTSDNNGIYYFLPLKGLDSDAEITVERVDFEGNTYPVVIPANQTKSNYDSAGQIYANVNRAGGYVWYSNTSDAPARLLESGIENNVTITASKTVDGAASTICGMKFNTWFGGDLSGLNGGVHLFVSGNPDYPNLVHWSDVNNPLYFPENNYAYIGGSSQKVTGFGKQGDLLVIFKEREMYGITYASNNVTADQLITGSITDAVLMTSIFRSYPINSAIGCDAPNTIQLCANKLVWMNSDGKVYTIVSTNQFSERNVRELGQNINTYLQQHTQSERLSASAADYDGHYYLLIGNKVYVMDYEDGSFQYYASFANDKKSQRGVAWYVWDVAVDGITWNRIIGSNSQPILCGSYQPSTGGMQLINYVFSDAAEHKDTLPTGTTSEYSCMAQTKVFDFGSPERLKDVPQAFVGIGNESNNAAISVSYLTNYGVSNDCAIISANSGGTNYREPNYITQRKLTPFMRRVTRFGMKLESTGAFALDNLVLIYSLYGGSVK